MDNQKQRENSANKIVSWSFWMTIIVLACIVIAANSGLFERDKEEGKEIPKTQLETILIGAARTAYSETSSAVDREVDRLYKPVYDAIPVYTDFHYSVRGEYMELYAALSGDMAKELESQVFGGFSDRFNRTGRRLDELFIEKYKLALDAETQEEIEGGLGGLGPISRFVLDDAVNRAATTVSIATVAIVAGKGGALKIMTTTMAKKLLAKIAIKTGSKAAAVAAGVGLSIAGCAPLLGPFAFVCGISAAIFFWFATDVVIVNLDEAFNRAEFEAELRAMIDEDKELKKQHFREALAHKAREVQRFTIRTLNEQTSDGTAN